MGLLVRAQGRYDEARKKLEAFVAIFADLKMPREHDAAAAELKKW